MRYFSIKRIAGIFCIMTLLIGCPKNGDTPAPPPNPPSPPTPPNPTPKTCIISGIFQQNSGPKPEFALLITYNSSLNPTRISAYDSATNRQLFVANLTYGSTDSIRIDAHQYIKLDASKRVTAFFTKSDMTDPQGSDNYRYEYIYNTEGFLITKNLYINGANSPTYVTTYTYSNGLLTSCLMVVASAGNKKVLEATLTYETGLTPKTMLYTFPDGFESYYYSTALNFGTRPNRPLKQVITTLFNPATGATIDVWTSNYSGYTINTDGYITYGVTTGEQQQGIASFFGKTTFTYQCQ